MLNLSLEWEMTLSVPYVNGDLALRSAKASILGCQLFCEQLPISSWAAGSVF